MARAKASDVLRCAAAQLAVARLRYDENFVVEARQVYPAEARSYAMMERLLGLATEFEGNLRSTKSYLAQCPA